MSTAQICHGLMVYPPWNVNHPARWRELERRGASCGHPGDIAASQRAAEGQLMDGIRTLNPPQTTTTCNWTAKNDGSGMMVCR